MAQRKETLDFWDAHHSQDSTTDWVLQPSEVLLDTIQTWIPSNGTVLEIGCGTSRLARELSQHAKTVSVVSTDVSPVCIRQNQTRDEKIIQESLGRLQYRVLDVLDPPSSHELGMKYDVVLDKGCFDTFLFRSQSKKKLRLIQTLLDNIYMWLKEGGVYIVLSPRSKIMLLRDYCGFSQVKRHVLKDEKGEGSCVGERDSKRYMYICHLQHDYQVGGIGPAFRDSSYFVSHPVPDNDACCCSCGMTFVQFTKGVDMHGKGEIYWIRRWKGHATHCRGTKNKC